MRRAALTLILICSTAFAAWNAYQISRNPAVTALTARSNIELTAALNRELHRAATPAKLHTKIETLLSQTPIDWLTVNALRDLAAARNIPLTPELTSTLQTQYDADHTVLKTSGKCISCGWDAANCELSAILVCRAPVDLTPIGDITGVIRESANYARGQPVDKLDLTLSALGLGATALAPATAGTSLAIKLGATTLKTTKKIGHLNPSLTRIITTSADQAIDWDKLATATPNSFPQTAKAAINSEALEPVLGVLAAAADMRGAIGIPQTLHMMKFVDNTQEAATTARIAKLSGPRTVGIFETLGKTRALRAGLKYSKAAWSFLAALLSAFTAALLLISNFAANRILRRARHRAHTKPGAP